MELEEFRNVDLVIDHVNKTFVEKQFVSQNDNDGRSLTVQVTNNGAVGEVTGLTLNLRWSNQSSGLTDLSAFQLIDKKNSVFQIKYPKNMLNPGKVLASIQIIQNGQVAHSKQFAITVQQLAGETKGIIEKAEFGALVKVLSDSNKFRTDIDTLEIKKATKDEVKVIESKKVDKNGAGQVGWGMLAQDARDQISGGKVAHVGKDSVSNESIVNNSISSDKLNFSDTFIFGSTCTITITESETILGKGAYRLYKNGKLYSFDLQNETKIDNQFGSVYWLVWDITTKQFSYIERKSTISPDYFVFGESWFTNENDLDFLELCQNRGNFIYNSKIKNKNSKKFVSSCGGIDSEFFNQNLSFNSFYISGGGTLVINDDYTMKTEGSLVIQDWFGKYPVVDQIVSDPPAPGAVYQIVYDKADGKVKYVVKGNPQKYTIVLLELWFYSAGASHNRVIELVPSNENFAYPKKLIVFELSTLKETPSVEIGETLPRLYSLNQCWADWQSGIPTQIGILGDSTTNGDTTTGNVINGSPGTISTSPNAYPNLTNDFLLDKFRLGEDVVLNGGYSGRNISWLESNLDSFFSGDFKNCKIFILRMGINDRVAYPNQAAFEKGYEDKLRKSIKRIYLKKIQPVLMTTQAFIQPASNNPSRPMWDTRSMRIANDIMIKLAEEYNLEVIDANLATEKFLQLSARPWKTIIADRLHFGDIGHKFEAEFLINSLNPLTLDINQISQIDYLTQNVNGGIVGRDNMSEEIFSGFKAIANYSKESESNELIFEVAVDNLSKRNTIRFLRKTVESKTYFKINGEEYDFGSALEKSVDLDIGSYVLSVYSGDSNKVDFVGIKID